MKFKMVKNKVLSFVLKKRAAAVKELMHRTDEILNTVLVISCILIYASLLITIWINVSLGLKILASAVITILAIVIIALTTKGEKEEKNK